VPRPRVGRRGGCRQAARRLAIPRECHGVEGRTSGPVCTAGQQESLAVPPAGTDARGCALALITCASRRAPFARQDLNRSSATEHQSARPDRRGRPGVRADSEDLRLSASTAPRPRRPPASARPRQRTCPKRATERRWTDGGFWRPHEPEECRGAQIGCSQAGALPRSISLDVIACTLVRAWARRRAVGRRLPELACRSRDQMSNASPRGR
jgi:hypothetical protein